MAHVNEVLSKELHVKPLVKDQVVVFRLLEADKDDLAITDKSGKPRKRTPGYQLCGKKRIYDVIAGKTVTIENESTEREIQTPMGPIKRFKPSPICFTSDKPAIAVRHDQPERYAFMMRMDENVDNPFRNPNAQKVFYVVDAKKRVMKDNELREFKLEALNWVYKTASYTELKACAEKAMKLRSDVKIKTDYKDSEASLGFEMLKRELGALSESDPVTVVKGSTNMESIMRLQIKDSERFGLTLWVEKDRTWYHNEKDLVKICTVEPLKNKEEALIKCFADEKQNGHVHYAKMLKSLEIFLTPR